MIALELPIIDRRTPCSLLVPRLPKLALQQLTTHACLHYIATTLHFKVLSNFYLKNAEVLIAGHLTQASKMTSVVLCFFAPPGRASSAEISTAKSGTCASLSFSIRGRALRCIIYEFYSVLLCLSYCNSY